MGGSVGGGRGGSWLIALRMADLGETLVGGRFG